jgi:hypothetical protein
LLFVRLLRLHSLRFARLARFLDLSAGFADLPGGVSSG